MSQPNYFVRNSVSVIGSVAEIFKSEKATVVVVNTGRWGYSHRANYPKIVCFGRCKEEADKLNRGDYAQFRCTMQTNERDENIRNQDRQSVIGNRITVISSAEDRSAIRPHPECDFNFVGRIVGIYPFEDRLAINLTLQIFTHTRRVEYLRLTYYAKNKEDFDAFLALENENRIHLTGQVLTSRKQREDGSFKYYENCIINDYEILPTNTSR